MIEVKQLSGKLDLDSSFYKVAKEDYVEALNIGKDAVEGSNDVSVTNIVGNQLVVNNYVTRLYSNSNFNLFATVYDNLIGSQNIRVSFTPVTTPNANAVSIDYFDGASWVVLGFSSPNVSPIDSTLPLGDYAYRFTVYSTIAPLETYYILAPVVTTYKTIGSYANTLRNTIIYFQYNPLGYSSILEYNDTTRAITPIFRNLIDSGFVDILQFTENDKINNINVYNREEGDLLFFLDSLGRPTGLDIPLFKARSYVPVTRDIINVAKNPPLSPTQSIYGNDTTRRTNNTTNKLFRFSYRYHYDNNEISSPAPIGYVPLPVNILDITYTNVITNNNVINISLNSGDKQVKAVELLMSFVNKTNDWSAFASVSVYNKADNSIADDVVFNFPFYNDSTYPTIPPSEAIQLFDYVPDKAKSQELANGNVLVYGAITEGLSRDISPNVVNTVGTYAAGTGSEGNLSEYTNFRIIFGGKYFYSTVFNGIPAVGTVVALEVRKISDGLYITAATYTTVAGDTISNVLIGLLASAISIGIFGDLSISGDRLLYSFSTALYFNTVRSSVVSPAVSADINSIPTFKFSTTKDIGIAYFNKQGKSNGILYNGNVTFPAYAENGSQQVLLPFINTKIYHRPPLWAYSFQFFFTKEPSSYLYWETVNVNDSEADFIYFDVSNIVYNQKLNPTTAQVLNYIFQDGDRLRLIRKVSDDTVYPDTYDTPIIGLLDSPTINGVAQTGKQFLKINKTAPFNTVDYSTNNFVIEMYRPSQQQANDDNKTYYEFGEQFPILNPETVTRVHAGMVSSQSIDLATPAEFNFYAGDSYFRRRKIPIQFSDAGNVLFFVQDRNFVDFYISAVSSLDGTPSVIDENARETYFPALIRFGQAYQANTNINGFNRFYSNNFDEYDYSYGAIMRLKSRDRFMRVFQQYKVGMVPIYSQINKDQSGNEIRVQTDKLLNPIQYYVGDFGIGDQPESLASFNYADYFTTNVKGIVARASNNGLEAISILYKTDSWATEQLPLRIGNSKVYGVYEARLNKYIIALEAATGQSAVSITFNEKINGFESFLSMHPEMMCNLGVLLISFKEGELYTHDNANYNTFFGVVYDSSITPVYNQNTLEKKTYLAISEVASEVWGCPVINTSINSFSTTKQQSNLIDSDFEQKEGVFHASFLRDENSQGGLINGDALKGNYLTIKFRKQIPTNLVSLDITSLYYIDSPLTTR